MTNRSAADGSPAEVARIRLPGVAVALFVASVLLIVVGALTLLGTSSRSFFENAPTQASTGALLLITGVLALVGGLVLVGVRSIAQQQVDALARRG